MLNKIVKVLTVIFVGCFVLSICSCGKLSAELSDTMIIQGMAIDKVGDNIKVTVEILNNLQSGTPSGEGNSPDKTRIFSSVGKTVSEAVNDITLKSGNTPLYTHNRVIILGEEISKDGVEEILDFFARDYGSKPSMLVCVAKGEEASKVINADISEDTVKSEVLENILKISSDRSFSLNIKLSDVSNILLSNTDCLCIPAVTVAKNDNKKEYALSGCAVFNSDNKLVNYLDTEETKSLVFLKNEVSKGDFSVELSKNKNASFLIVKSKTKYKINIENGYPVCVANISVSADLNEISNNNYNTIDKSVIKSLSQAAEKEIKERTEKTFYTIAKNGTDALSIGKRINLKNDDYYKENNEKWDDVMKNSKIQVNVTVKIRRTGDESFLEK